MALSSKTVQIKLVLLGEAAVGKSSLVLRFVNDEFQENKEPTIGAAFLTQRLQHGDYSVKYEIWDTAGQERFHSLAPMYYRNAQTALVVYDISNALSFDRAKNWIRELQRQANANIVIALVGNKCDLEDSRVVSAKDAAEFANEEGLTFVETSAKNGSNVKKVFEELAKRLPLDALLQKSMADAERSMRGNNGSNGSIRVDAESRGQSRSCC